MDHCTKPNHTLNFYSPTNEEDKYSAAPSSFKKTLLKIRFLSKESSLEIQSEYMTDHLPVE